MSHEAVGDWETKLLPVMGDELRKRRHGTRRGSGMSWYVDETYLKVRGSWTYLYRAIDRDGNLIDAMLSEHRDMKAAKAFFRSARATMGFRPDRVTTDGHGSYPKAIRTVLGKSVRHRTSVYLNNRLEQDHSGIKGRIQCMRGFKSHHAASRFCREHGELRDLLRCRRRHNQALSASPPPLSLCQGNQHRAQHHAERVNSPGQNDEDKKFGLRPDTTSRSNSRVPCRTSRPGAPGSGKSCFSRVLYHRRDAIERMFCREELPQDRHPLRQARDQLRQQRLPRRRHQLLVMSPDPSGDMPATPAGAGNKVSIWQPQT